MQQSSSEQLKNVYPACYAHLGDHVWKRIVAGCHAGDEIVSFERVLTAAISELGLPQYLPELARLELIRYRVATAESRNSSDVEQLEINPTIHLMNLSWRGLARLVDSDSNHHSEIPKRGEERVIVWRHPKNGEVIVSTATDEDLLVLKIVSEDRDLYEVAEVGSLPVGAVDWALDRAVDRGLLLAPRTIIRREGEHFRGEKTADDEFLESPFFTIQWHITQACDLNCKHCYDRSKRSPLKPEQAYKILDDLRAFCRDRHVLGQVSFTGGNPFLYPHFLELYQAASERGFITAILGNPVSRKDVERMTALRKPAFYQVSLEGLREHNDYIRGEGTFDNVLEFLDILHEFEIPSQVMLTLTRDNLNQVIPLAEVLRHRADFFTFNRLAQVGEGANLLLPTRDEYITFLREYVRAAEHNPVMGLKDNLINIILHENDLEPFGGCAGYGCSAAFNFMAVLPDGEAHACRKLPSLIGNVYEQSISEIYDSERARRYRSGTKACRSCQIRPVCGGCLAVVYGLGLDIFEACDPYCFMDPSPSVS